MLFVNRLIHLDHKLFKKMSLTGIISLPLCIIKYYLLFNNCNFNLIRNFMFMGLYANIIYLYNIIYNLVSYKIFIW